MRQDRPALCTAIREVPAISSGNIFSQKTPKEIDTKEGGRRHGGRICAAGSESIQLWLFLDNRQFRRVRCIVTKIASQTAGNFNGPKLRGAKKTPRSSLVFIRLCLQIDRKKQRHCIRDRQVQTSQKQGPLDGELQACRPAMGRACAGELRRNQGSSKAESPDRSRKWARGRMR